MKFKRILLISFVLLVALLGIAATSAMDSDNIAVNADNNDSTVYGVEDTDSVSDVEIDDLKENKLGSSDDGAILGEVHVIDSDEKNNEMNYPTIQPVIDSASAHDTIIINGEEYEHCHFIVDKPLTIISNVGTKLSPCTSNTKGSGHLGIFYIAPEASGTIIEGFTLISSLGREDDYAILVGGATDVTIRNCEIRNNALADGIRIEDGKNTVIENVTANSLTNAIEVRNSQNTLINNSVLKNSNIGVNIIDSTQTKITNNVITSNKASGVLIDGKSSDTTVSSNNITGNKGKGIDAEVADSLYILSNYIDSNKNSESGAGIYINCNITKLEIKGNFLKENGNYAILYDYRVRNIGPDGLGENVANVSDNYMFGHTDRAIYHITYNKDSKGSFSYDEENDVYEAVGYGNGDYSIGMTTAYLGYNYLINDALCPSIYYTWGSLWSAGNYRLVLSNISQIKKGEYSISIVNPKGDVAKELNSVYVTFYLNKENTLPTPQTGDVYKTVLIQNGTATVSFEGDEFKESGNILTASLPGPNPTLTANPYMKLTIADSDIPNAVDTVLTVSNLTTYPNSGDYVIANLKDAFGNALSNQNITFAVNSKTGIVATDENGDAKFKVSIPKEGSYTLNASYAGDDTDYYGSDAQSTVTVKKESTKIIANDLYMVPNLGEDFTVILRDNDGNPIAKQIVIFTVNGKSCTRTTDSNGKASIRLTYNRELTNKITLSYTGNDEYVASSASKNIYVKYSSKTPQLITPTVGVPPTVTKCYTITLRGSDGKPLANERLIVNLDGVKSYVYTNANGQAGIKINYNAVGEHKVYVGYAGNKIYKMVFSSGWIKVAKVTAKFDAQNVTMLPKEQKTIPVTLTTSSGEKLAKQKVTIKVNGLTVNRVTDSNGQFIVKIAFNEEKNYHIALIYPGDVMYKPVSVMMYANVKKIATSIESFDKTFSKDSAQNFTVSLKDKDGNALSNQNVIFTFNNANLTKTTDSNGQAGINIAANAGEFDIVTTYGGSDKYASVSTTNCVTVLDGENVVYIDSGLNNNEIQKILDSCENGDVVKFLGDSYDNISLTVSKQLDISPQGKTTLNAAQSCPVFSIFAENTNISNFEIYADSADAVDVSANNVMISNNDIANKLDSSKSSQYYNSTLPLPGYGVNISNSAAIDIVNNTISLFESGIYAEGSSNLAIRNNILKENNYGIKYGHEVADSQITGNLITECIGLYTMEEPEGPRGYGIFLNNSAVNVNITKNDITWSHLGISVDANGSTGIVITGNLITDNVLEGIRFNAGYDLAENAVEPLVTDNAIYRNARGPSLMILGEMSANPFGIYGPGEWDDNAKLKIAPNWYGVNALQTWNNETGIVGIGTMCPRIKTSEIKFDEIVVKAPESYSITFTKDGEIASNLPEFDLYATLNRGSENELEVNFKVVKGVGEFSFDTAKFKYSSNVIEISVGSLNSSDRVFKSFFTYAVPEMNF